MRGFRLLCVCALLMVTGFVSVREVEETTAQVGEVPEEGFESQVDSVAVLS